MKLPLPEKLKILNSKPIVLWVGRWVKEVPKARHWYCEIRDYKGKILYSDKFKEWSDAMCWFAKTFIENFPPDTPYICEYLDKGNEKLYFNWFDKVLRKYWSRFIIKE